MSLNVFRMIELSGHALSAQRTRMEVASSNLANAHTTRTPEGGPYRRQDVVLVADGIRDHFGSLLDDSMDRGARSVKVSEIRPDSAPPKMVYDPSHPDSNAQGYVAYPNINSVEEMVNLTTIMRTYQSNIAAFSALQEMAKSAINLGNTTS